MEPDRSQLHGIDRNRPGMGHRDAHHLSANCRARHVGIMDEKGWWWDNTGSIQTTFLNNKVTLVK